MVDEYFVHAFQCFVFLFRLQATPTNNSLPTMRSKGTLNDEVKRPTGPMGQNEGLEKLANGYIELCLLKCLSNFKLHNNWLDLAKEVLVQPTKEFGIGELQMISWCCLKGDLASLISIFQAKQILLVKLRVFHGLC